MIAYMKLLWELEEAGERVPVQMGPFTAISVIGMLQLALRHPEMTGPAAVAARGIIDQMRPFFTGTEGETIINMGDNPEYDR